METVLTILMDDDGQIVDVQSISVGLDYPGVGPEHAWLNSVGRVKYISAIRALHLCARLEGIILAFEPAHAILKAIELATKMPRDHLMVINLCGRGDKDPANIVSYLAGSKR